MTQKPCNNKFIDPDGYCTMCGLNHLKTQKTRAQQQAQAKKAAWERLTPEQKHKEIELAIESNPVYKTFRDTVRTLSDLYNIPVKVVFMNAEQSTYAHFDPKGKHYIKAGYQVLSAYAQRGFEEYETIKNLFPQVHRATGTKAAAVIAAHEFAHILAITNANGLSDNHGPLFCTAYDEVLSIVL